MSRKGLSHSPVDLNVLPTLVKVPEESSSLLYLPGWTWACVSHVGRISSSLNVCNKSGRGARSCTMFSVALSRSLPTSHVAGPLPPLFRGVTPIQSTRVPPFQRSGTLDPVTSGGVLGQGVPSFYYRHSMQTVS